MAYPYFIMEVILVKFLSSNTALFRMLRTIAQGILGVLIANADVLIKSFEIPDIWKPIIVALVMAILSPIMASLGGKVDDE